MPREWYDRHAVKRIKDDEQRALYRSIVAPKKPYFMRYIYPSLKKEYNTYIKNTNTNALREFGMTVEELQEVPYKDLTERQREFLTYYDRCMPVGTGSCVMNKICKLVEKEFDGYIARHNKNTKFDYRIMKSDSEYTLNQYYEIKRVYDEYNKRLESYMIYVNHERIDKYDAQALFFNINETFKEECTKICPNRKVLCNIVLDLCYKKKSTKRFAWNISGDEIIENLLVGNDWMISYPTADEDGDIDYCGNAFSLEKTRIEVDEYNNT